MKTPHETQLVSTLTVANAALLVSTTIQLMSSPHLSKSLNGAPMTGEIIQGIACDHIVKSLEQPANS